MMPKLTVMFAALLLILGFASYIFSGRASISPLIPAFFGAPIFAFGLLARKEPLRKHMMHAAVALALLGLLGTVGNLIRLFTLIGGEGVERPAAVIVQSAMALFCAGYVALAIKSFVDARRGRRA